MHILEMQAAYGRLRGDSLRLEPGLNLIYAPNESGKSTWCSFIRTMLYGLPTRQSGPLADKNRFAPWTGEAMQGRMDLETDGRRWTVLRDTRRAGVPMQNFACTYTGTAQPVPEVNGQNLGETLLGVPREVFQRSAFIGQSGLAVSQDPELERRIAALLSTGQEDVSYSESYDRLKKQLNRRRHNKTGLIPQLEQEQARLDDALRRQAELSAQLENAREQQCTAQTRVEELEQRQAQWEALEKQEALRQWRETQEDLARRRQQLTALQQLDGNLPDRDTLARMQAQLELLEQAGGTLTQARRIAQQRQTEAREAQEAWSAHPLYPNDENQLRQQAEAMTAPAGPGKTLPIAAVVLLCAAAAALALLPAPAKLITAAIGAAAAVGLFLYYMVSRRRAADAAQTVQTRKTALQRQTEAYLRLREDARQAEDAARTAAASAEGLTQQLQGQLVTLLAQVQPFWPEANGADGVRVALTAALRRREALDGAALQVQKAQIRCDAMSRHLPQPPAGPGGDPAPAGAVPGADRRRPAPGPESAAGSPLPGGQPYRPAADHGQPRELTGPAGPVHPAAGGPPGGVRRHRPGHGGPDPGQHRPANPVFPGPGGGNGPDLLRHHRRPVRQGAAGPEPVPQRPARRGRHAPGPVPAEPGCGRSAVPGGAAGHLPDGAAPG